MALQEAKALPDISELVIISTCNRVELHGYTERDHLPEDALFRVIHKTHAVQEEEFAPYLYRYEGDAALRHLFRVTAGLDSLVLGENEILGQVREAFRFAIETSSVHSLLYRLMEKALKIGKDIRTQTKINQGAVSIPSVAVELAEKIFGRLTGEKVMVLGTGEISVMTLKSLKGAGADVVYVVSRNRERGEQVAGDFGSQWISLETWEEHLASIDILIASTAAPHPIVRFEQIQNVMKRRRSRPLFLIDIAVPRDIEAHVNSLDDVYLYNIDDLKGVSASNLRLRRKEIQAAEQMIEQAVVDFKSWLEQLEARPTLERFESYLDQILEKELGGLSKKGYSEASIREIQHRLRSKLLHMPFEKIKEASKNGGVTRYVEALQSLFGL